MNAFQDSRHVTYSQYIACKNPFRTQNTVPHVCHVTSSQNITCKKSLKTPPKLLDVRPVTYT